MFKFEIIIAGPFFESQPCKIAKILFKVVQMVLLKKKTIGFAWIGETGLGVKKDRKVLIS